jgi:hypothetical protein
MLLKSMPSAFRRHAQQKGDSKVNTIRFLLLDARPPLQHTLDVNFGSTNSLLYHTVPMALQCGSMKVTSLSR